MITFVSEFKAKPVLLRKEMALVGICDRLVFDTDTGKLAGAIVREGFGKRHLKAVPEKDIQQLTTKYLLISGYEVLGDIDEFVRLKAIVDKNINVSGLKTYTVGGEYLGKVRDFTIDLGSNKIDKIYVVPRMISGRLKEYVISYKQIVSIDKDRIVVEDASIMEAKEAKGSLADAAN